MFYYSIPCFAVLYNSTQIDTKTIFGIIAKARGKSGGTSRISYNSLFTMAKLKHRWNILIQSITKFMNALANQKITNLEHILASRCIPVQKKMDQPDLYA